MAALILLVVVGCGGGGSHRSRPTTVDYLGTWLKEAGECEGVETEVTRLPVAPSRLEEVAPANERFDKQATIAGLIDCGGLNGYISYVRFPSARARATAVRGRSGLISNELFCAKGPELVINDLLGYDNTIGFCRRLGFPIHRPTHIQSASAEHRHRLEETAARLFARATGSPSPNVFCRSTKGRLEFECEEIVGGEVADVTLVERRGRYAIEGCESPGPRPAPDGFRGESCAFPDRPR